MTTTANLDLTASEFSAPAVVDGTGRFFPATASGVALTLASFSLPTALLSLINVGWLDAKTVGVVIPVAYAYGALAALIGGLWEFRSNSLFGATVGVSFGCFWIGTGLVLQFFGATVTKAAGADAFGKTFGAYLILWAIFSAYMAVGAYFIVKPAFMTLVLIVVLLSVLGLANIIGGGTGANLTKLGGYVGLAAAAVSWYLSAALVINTTSGKDIMPLFPYTPR
jgi:succinate-acetate transporter protein